MSSPIVDNKPVTPKITNEIKKPKVPYFSLRGMLGKGLFFLAGTGVASLYFFYHYVTFMVKSDIEYKKEIEGLKKIIQQHADGHSHTGTLAREHESIFPHETHETPKH